MTLGGFTGGPALFIACISNSAACEKHNAKNKIAVIRGAPMFNKTAEELSGALQSPQIERGPNGCDQEAAGREVERYSTAQQVRHVQFLGPLVLTVELRLSIARIV